MDAEYNECCNKIEENSRLNAELAALRFRFEKGIEQRQDLEKRLKHVRLKHVMRNHAELEKNVKQLIKQNERLLTAREANINEIARLEEEKQELCLDLDYALRKLGKLLTTRKKADG